MVGAPAAGPDVWQGVLREMRDLAIPMTAESYAVWREYRLGADPQLRRILDVMLGNDRVPDHAALHRLYEQYCAPRHQTVALQDVGARALATLERVTAYLSNMQGAATDYRNSLRAASVGLEGNAEGLPPLLHRLADETQEMISQSALLVRQLNQSASRIEELEQFLGEARQEAATDTLTELPNRRAFDAALKAAAAAAMNSEEQLAVLLADADHFKRVNDTWGHETGDRVLRAIADAMRQAVRGRDFEARYGGEEFVAILPDTGSEGALAVADNIRVAVSRQSVPAGKGEPDLFVTISVGVSVYDAGEKLSQLLARADAALYQAKQDGRNRAVLAKSRS